VLQPAKIPSDAMFYDSDHMLSDTVEIGRSFALPQKLTVPTDCCTITVRNRAMRNRCVLAVTVGVALVVGGNTKAHASPIYYAIASAVVTDLGIGGAQDSDSTGLVNNSDSAGPASADLPGGSAFASVTDGSLHAFATSSPAVTSNATASFFDTLLLTSATLAPGTIVSLLGELAFSATVTPNGVNGPCIGGSVAYGGIDTGTSLGNAGSLLVQDHTCDNMDINNSTSLIQGIIGEELTVNAFLNAGTSAITAGTADASNTLRFFLTPIGNFTYSTASGNNYINQVQPVPEPSSLLLLGSGLILGVFRLRACCGAPR
jgi:hypothetical protein